MKLVLPCCFLLALATEASAHRLDEYLQATRIAVATNRIDLFIELTPGVAVVGKVVAEIDKDRDGAVSKEEGEVYARRLLQDISIELNGGALAVTEVETSVPTMSEMNAGTGVIQIRAAAPIPRLTEGAHTLVLTNVHLTGISVYLVNALVPKDPSINIIKQVRDESQKRYRLEFVSASSLP